MEDNKPAKQEQAAQGLTRLKSGEWEVAEALNTKRIFLCSDDEIKEPLRYCMLLTGIRSQNMPVDEEKLVLINFIRKEFGTHHIGELSACFNAAFKGEFEVDTCCYENFSVEYFTRIFKAYRAWVVDKVKGFKPIEPELPAIEQKHGDSWGEIWERLIVEDWEGNQFYELAPWSAIYDWLKKEQGVTPTEDQINQARVQVLGRLQRKVPQTPSEKQEIERMKCIDWREDMKVLRYISTEVKTITVKQLLHKLKKERNEENKNID